MRTICLVIFCATAVLAQNIPCGVSSVEHSMKIVGGEAARLHEFPWQVSLQINSERRSGRPERWSHVCGGSVLTPTRVLTAAHCKIDNMPYRVVAGLHDWKNMSSTGVTEAMIEKFEAHENYNSPNDLMNDIAIIHLAKPLTLQEGVVVPVCLPEAMKNTSAETMLSLSGWGTVSEGGDIPRVLQRVDVPVITDEKCRESYQPSMSSMMTMLPVPLSTMLQGLLPPRYFQPRIADSMLCAGYENGGKDSCQGDSGGPAVVFENKIAYQMGVVSWGEGCARRGKPGVYSEVSHYMDWINERIK